MENVAFVIERTFHAPAAAVWKAITDKEEMKKWYFSLQEFQPEVGFKFQFLSGPDENRQYLHLCEITEVIADTKIAYSWRYDGYEGNTLVSFELFPDGNVTKLKLTHSGLKSFPADNPDFDESSFAEGWTWIIGTSLKEYLSKIVKI